MSKSALVPQTNNIVMRNVSLLVLFLATLGAITWFRRRSG
jgi:hypothetical protein